MQYTHLSNYPVKHKNKFLIATVAFVICGALTTLPLAIANAQDDLSLPGEDSAPPLNLSLIHI